MRCTDSNFVEAWIFSGFCFAIVKAHSTCADHFFALFLYQKSNTIYFLKN